MFPVTRHQASECLYDDSNFPVCCGEVTVWWLRPQTCCRFRQMKWSLYNDTNSNISPAQARLGNPKTGQLHRKEVHKSRTSSQERGHSRQSWRTFLSGGELKQRREVGAAQPASSDISYVRKRNKQSRGGEAWSVIIAWWEDDEVGL